ncbi:MAG: hypothetical protein V1701_12470 [Planctomycetota bacterium]
MENRCKECGRRVPTGKRIEAFACQMLGLCRYCYRGRFHKVDSEPVLRESEIDPEVANGMFDCANTSPWEWMEEVRKE